MMKIKTKQFNRQKHLWIKSSIEAVLAQIRFQCKRQSKTERSEAFWANIKNLFFMFPPTKSSSGYELNDYADVLCHLEPFRVMMSARWSKKNEILSCTNIQNITLKIKTSNNIIETYIHKSSVVDSIK